jgi:hypothetical protein
MIGLYLVVVTVLLLVFIVLLTVPEAPRCPLFAQTSVLGPLDRTAVLGQGGFCGIAGWDSPGNDLLSTPASLDQDTPLASCVEYCNHQPGCNGFVWGAAKSSCALKQWPSAQTITDGRKRVLGAILAMRKVPPSAV